MPRNWSLGRQDLGRGVGFAGEKAGDGGALEEVEEGEEPKWTSVEIQLLLRVVFSQGSSWVSKLGNGR